MGNFLQRESAEAFAGGYSAIDTAQYDAYGNMLADIQTTNHDAALSRQESIGFGGQWGYFTDYNNITNSDIGAGTGLLCLGHRYYDTGTGRFINRDPIGYAGGENLYAFCGGNPINEMDPGGTGGLYGVGGHHLIPVAIFRNSQFSAEVKSFFASTATGPIGSHFRHDAYSDAVNDLLQSYMKGKGITESTMSLDQAREFVSVVQSSQNPAIRKVLDSIALSLAQKVAESAAAGDSVAGKIASQQLIRTVGEEAAMGFLEKAGPFAGKAAGPIVTLSIFAIDWHFSGFAKALSHATWGVSDITLSNGTQPTGLSPSVPAGHDHFTP
jgi:RHS repeat-associated protein